MRACHAGAHMYARKSGNAEKSVIRHDLAFGVGVVAGQGRFRGDDGSVMDPSSGSWHPPGVVTFRNGLATVGCEAGSRSPRTAGGSPASQAAASLPRRAGPRTSTPVARGRPAHPDRREDQIHLSWPPPFRSLIVPEAVPRNYVFRPLRNSCDARVHETFSPVKTAIWRKYGLQLLAKAT